MIEKRRVKRFDLKLKACVRAAAGAAEPAEAFELTTRDISTGGAFLYTSTPLTVGTAVDIHLILAPEKEKSQGMTKAWVQVSGSVLRIEEDGMAVCFDDDSKILPYPGGERDSCT
jgi:c-di-GMP-binding flagellar brake protein YcgR